MVANLRILKKLCKRAAPLLPQLGDHREQFPARRHDNYHEAFIADRNCWERSHCHASYEPRSDWLHGKGAEIRYVTRAGRHMVMRVPSHPLAGTVMVGATSGYYEPEWDEECAWVALETAVRDHFTDWSGCDTEDEAWRPTLTRPLDTVSQIFAAARDILSERATPSPLTDRRAGSPTPSSSTGAA